MYCDPVTCVCFTAENTYMIIASCFRSFLEHQISGLCICLSYHVCFLPLIGSSVAYSFLHCFILISVDHCPGNKTTAVQSVCADGSGALASLG